MAQANEAFASLDGTEITLTGVELVIRYDKKTLALAGVVGARNSGVQDRTKNLGKNRTQ